MRKLLFLLVVNMIFIEASYPGVLSPKVSSTLCDYVETGSLTENDNTSAARDMELMSINGEKVPVSELVYYYRNLSEKTSIPEYEYFHTFYMYKLKVADARLRNLDQTTEFKEQLISYKQNLINKIVIDSLSNYIYRTGYLSSGNYLSSRPKVKIQIVTYRLSQKASAQEERSANLIMDKIHDKICQGFDFSEVSGIYSNNANLVFSDYSEKGICKSFLLDEINSAISRTRTGDISAVFSSPEGLHILKPLGVITGVSENDVHDLARKLILSGMYDKSTLERIYRNTMQSIATDSDIRHRLTRLEDDLLAKLWEENNVLYSSEISESDLKDYFKKHKEDYSWDFPHFKGGVIHCKSKKSARKIKKLLKSFPVEKWQEVLAVMKNEHPEFDAEVETGLFKIGSNPYIDKLAFKCGSMPEQVSSYPYTFVLGKRLKKGPDDYKDVAEKVVDDYKKDLEIAYFTALEKKFHVEIHQDVLKTVNCSGSN